MSGKQKILLAVTLTSLLICSSGALYGYFRLWPKLQAHASTALEDEIATQVQRSTSAALALRDPSDTVRLTAEDLDFSTINDGSGESGFDIVNGDATIYNGVVEIGAGQITFYLADMLFTAIPTTHDGGLDLVERESEGGVTGVLVETSILERGVERGINAALAQANLRLRNVLIVDDMLYLTVGPNDPTA